MISHLQNYKPGDYIEFKNADYNICRGKIIKSTDPSLFEVMEADGKIILINPLYITKHYPHFKIKHLTLRLVLQDIWKHFIFREVKTVKTKDLFRVTHQYVNNMGFVRTDTYKNVTTLNGKIPYKNIQIHYKDFFGFSTDRTIRNNDIYYNQEIFFSKKCYEELNLNGKCITGDFSHRRGFKTNPPHQGQYICGLVENGEKGLFFRKWFVCSKEFLTLWTVICEPEHYSLKYKKDDIYTTKSLSDILSELDTSHYDITNNEIMSIKEIQRHYISHNLESYALYTPDLYQKILLSIFDPKSLNDDLYDYSKKIKADVLWMK